MLGYEKRPTPPIWKILLYTVLALLFLLALGWYNTNVLGDKTQYPNMSSSTTSTASQEILEQEGDAA